MAHTIEKIRTRRSSRKRSIDRNWRPYGQENRTLAEFFANNRRKMTQVFWVDPLRATTIKTRGGMRFHIPALAFQDEWGDITEGKVKIEIIELNKKKDILLADRATTSGDRMLETDGAFFFGASQRNNPLRFNMPVRAQVPISSRVSTPAYMAVFGGRNRNGRFDWTPAQGQQAGLEVNQLDQTFDLSVPQPGWINCDHYYRLRQEQHYDLTVTPNTEFSEQAVFLLYRTINTVVKMKVREDGRFYFPAPAPLPSLIYSLGQADGVFYQGFQPFLSDPYDPGTPGEIQPKEVSLSMQATPAQDIDRQLEEQIRYWDEKMTNLIEERYSNSRMRAQLYRRLRERQQRER